MTVLVEADTIGEAWLGIAALVMADGEPAHYDGRPILELSRATLAVAHPDPDDALIARYANPERLAWMRANFLDHSRVAELGDARSYASRLRDYAGVGRDQVLWVIDRLRADSESRSSTITTFEPLLDTSYIPCVSMLDFWMPRERLELVVYAHSIDFGSKGYGNLVQLAAVQREVAASLNVPVGRLDFVVKSAHVYDTEFEYMRGVLEAAA
ncbi:MAG: thymidylate synthase [Rhodoglobus sp.]